VGFFLQETDKKQRKKSTEQIFALLYGLLESLTLASPLLLTAYSSHECLEALVIGIGQVRYMRSFLLLRGKMNL